MQDLFQAGSKKRTSCRKKDVKKREERGKKSGRGIRERRKKTERTGEERRNDNCGSKATHDGGFHVLPRQPASQRGRKRHRRSGKGGPGLVVSPGREGTVPGGREGGDGERGGLAAFRRSRVVPKFGLRGLTLPALSMRATAASAIARFPSRYEIFSRFSRKRRFCASVSAPLGFAHLPNTSQRGRHRRRQLRESAFTAHGVLYAGQLIGSWSAVLVERSELRPIRSVGVSG
jgi:hypothetical protein